jgi:Flp pilus assembly protein TadB
MTAAAAAGPSGFPLWAVCAIAFVAILGLALLVLLGPASNKRRRKHDARLGELRRYRLLTVYQGLPDADADQAGGPRPITVRALGLLDRFLQGRGLRAALAERLERAGLRMRPEEWAAIQLSATVAPAALGLFLFGLLGIVGGGLLGWFGCWLFLRLKTSRRAAAFEAQLPDALQLVAGALRAGFALNQSVGAVARDGSEPVAGEFARVLQEVRLGAELEDALDALATRMDSQDLHLVMIAIRTAREIGGNLAEVLQTTVATMRERVQLRGQVKVLSAEGRFSAKVLTGLPLIMTVYLLVFRKGYLKPMYSTGLGVAILISGGVLLLIGAVWLRRLTQIEV